MNVCAKMGTYSSDMNTCVSCLSTRASLLPQTDVGLGQVLFTVVLC